MIFWEISLVSFVLGSSISISLSDLICKYNSIKEEEEFEFIQKHFKGDVICPNKHLGELAKIIFIFDN